jgi:hypothetical protein
MSSLRGPKGRGNPDFLNNNNKKLDPRVATLLRMTTLVERKRPTKDDDLESRELTPRRIKKQFAEILTRYVKNIYIKYIKFFSILSRNDNR